jgi:REP element-mobilizing transposase RayT
MRLEKSGQKNVCQKNKNYELAMQRCFLTLRPVSSFDVEARGFLLTAWVFLPDHRHAVTRVRYPKILSRVIESIKVSSARQINTQPKEPGRL